MIGAAAAAPAGLGHCSALPRSPVEEQQSEADVGCGGDRHQGHTYCIRTDRLGSGFRFGCPCRGVDASGPSTGEPTRLPQQHRSTPRRPAGLESFLTSQKVCSNAGLPPRLPPCTVATAFLHRRPPAVAVIAIGTAEEGGEPDQNPGCSRFLRSPLRERLIEHQIGGRCRQHTRTL